MKDYTDAVNWITGLTAHGIKPGLKRMEYMMERLDNPHRRLKFIHIAGTNGKGSTCAILTAILKQCGYKVGTFTSPYIEKYTNRIRIDGEDISEEDLLTVCNQIRPLAEELAETELGSPSMFEVSTVLAIQYFARIAVPNYVVWETGLGGRLDSTNIVYPVVSAITNIGEDHMDILGPTIAHIAEEKAGIIKHGVPTVSAVRQPELRQRIAEIAAERNSTLYQLERHFSIEPLTASARGMAFDFEGPFRRIETALVSLMGDHQYDNAAVALMVIDVLRQYYALIADEGDVLAGLRQVSWPGRLEMLPSEPPILIDGAHNPQGAESLAAALGKHYSYEDLHMVIGMLQTKNHKGYLRHILPLTNTLIVTEPDYWKGMPATELQQLAEEVKAETGANTVIELVPGWKDALERLSELTSPQDLAVVSGTLYLISDVRAWLLNQSQSEKGW